MRSVYVNMRCSMAFSSSTTISSLFACVHIWMIPFMSRYRLSMSSLLAPRPSLMRWFTEGYWSVNQRNSFGIPATMTVFRRGLVCASGVGHHLDGKWVDRPGCREGAKEDVLAGRHKSVRKNDIWRYLKGSEESRTHPSLPFFLWGVWVLPILQT